MLPRFEPPNHALHLIAARWRLCLNRKATCGRLAVSGSLGRRGQGDQEAHGDTGPEPRDEAPMMTGSASAALRR